MKNLKKLDRLLRSACQKLQAKREEPPIAYDDRGIPRSFGSSIRQYRLGVLSLKDTAFKARTSNLKVQISGFDLEDIENGKTIATPEAALALVELLVPDEKKEELMELWRSSCEKPVAPALLAKPSISPEAEALLHDEERKIFET